MGKTRLLHTLKFCPMQKSALIFIMIRPSRFSH